MTRSAAAGARRVRNVDPLAWVERLDGALGAATSGRLIESSQGASDGRMHEPAAARVTRSDGDHDITVTAAGDRLEFSGLL